MKIFLYTKSCPDYPLYEYYLSRDHPSENYRYSYIIVDNSLNILPPIVVITDGDIAKEYEKKSRKKALIDRSEQEGYQEVQTFKPYWNVYNSDKGRINFFLTGIFPSPLITIYKK